MSLPPDRTWRTSRRKHESSAGIRPASPPTPRPRTAAAVRLPPRFPQRCSCRVTYLPPFAGSTPAITIRGQTQVQGAANRPMCSATRFGPPQAQQPRPTSPCTGYQGRPNPEPAPESACVSFRTCLSQPMHMSPVSSPTANPAERVLLGAGPSPVPQRVLRALASPTLGHLDPQYLAILDETCELLRQVFRTQQPTHLPAQQHGHGGHGVPRQQSD